MFLKINISFFLLFQVLLLSINASPIHLDVRIYSNANIQKVEVMVFSGKYEVLDNEKNKITELYKNAVITIQANESLVEIYLNNELLIKAPSVQLKGVGFLNTFQIEPLKPSFARRIYDDNIFFKANGNNLIIINNVELEHYIAGVVESEGGGSTTDIDFFLVQAITCRTYALANIRKHWNEGFHLCDDVHCQVYKGRCKTSLILMATSQTAGIVIVDENNKMISAAFHSNSGGQTMNSEDVWTIATPYLRSVVDTFSLSGKNAKWEKTMPTSEWLNYLKTKHNYPIDDSLKRHNCLHFNQVKRKVWLDEGIALKDIRRDLNLKSTFFSITESGTNVIFTGKGYGHGVGMSQEGAIRMIQLGYSYEDVIHFYYKNVNLVNFDKLDYFLINYNY